MVSSQTRSIPVKLRPTFEKIVAMTDAVCREHLNEEYAELCRELTAALCRKRPSPVERGKLETWACGIVYTIGSCNFLFDKSQTPHLTPDELSALFGVAKSTASGKATQIRKMFDISPLDTRWCLPSRLEDNPLVWMVQVNGFIVDVRHTIREVQEEAFRLGLIPYIPADRLESSAILNRGRRPPTRQST
jgi:hypothetical protein